MSNARTLASLIDGSNIVVPSGYGLDFGTTTGGTGTPSSGLLDDYEEGTWTPAISTNGTIPTSVTYSIYNKGWYTRIGNQVTITASLSVSNKGTGGTGNLRLTGFPFESTHGAASVAANVGASNFNTADPVFVYGTWNNGYQTFISQTTGNISFITWSSVNTNFSAVFQTSYLI